MGEGVEDSNPVDSELLLAKLGVAQNIESIESGLGSVWGQYLYITNPGEADHHLTYLWKDIRQNPFVAVNVEYYCAQV